MSTKYKMADEIPSAVLAARLNELANAVTEGQKGIEREFYMSVPAQCDHDADLVLAAAAERIEELEHRISLLEDEVAWGCGKTGGGM